MKLYINKIKIVAFLCIAVVSCKKTMYEVYKNENIPFGIEGEVTKIKYFKGGNTTLYIENIQSKSTDYIALDERFIQLINKGDFFMKKPYSNKCLIRRNDSIFYIDCYNLSQKMKDSLGGIEQWDRSKIGYWISVVNK